MPSAEAEQLLVQVYTSMEPKSKSYSAAIRQDDHKELYTTYVLGLILKAGILNHRFLARLSSNSSGVVTDDLGLLVHLKKVQELRHYLERNAS